MSDPTFDRVEGAASDVVSGDRADVVLHEEQLRVQLERFPLERVRLEKFIVSEERTVTVTVRREEVRLVREPLDPSSPLAPAAIDDFVGFTLHEEQIVVTTEAVPRERVWLRKERISHDEVVTADLRYERAEFERPS